jgi:uncharacterized membrane protein
MHSTTLQGDTHAEKSIVIARPPAKVYRFWRDFENLPRIMQHLESVHVLSDTRSHWVARAPAKTIIEWDAEIIDEEPNELIAWQSLEGADVPNAGSIRFIPVDEGRATELRVTLNYDAPDGSLGSAIATLFGEAPEQQLAQDLQRLKHVLEQ